jgi:hypothetical protein
VKELILLCGPPGSGKSTYVKNWLSPSDSEFYYYINQDSQGKEGHLEEFQKALKANVSIVIDRMGFSREQRERYLKPAREAGYKTKIIVLHVPLRVCLDRCIKRIPNHPTVCTEADASRAVNFFFSKYERVEDSEADVVERCYDIGVEKTPAIWIDIDNTLSNNDHREHYLNNPEGKKDWKGFFNKLGDDPVNEPIKAIANSFYVSELATVLICTARPEDYRRPTEHWLDHHQINYDHMIMRLRGDFRKDSIVKEMMLEFEIKPRYNLLFSVDDRKDVIDRIRTHGITVLDCAGEKGNF